jgi:hypothetical protein
MSGEGNLILTMRFKKPDAACDRRTYRDYVRRVLMHECTCPEVQDLCRLFVCDVSEVETKIVNHFMGKKGS